MKKRTLGLSKLEVSALGLGCMGMTSTVSTRMCLLRTWQAP